LTSELAVTIQHHPARAHLLPRLFRVFPDAEVCTDSSPAAKNPWLTYQACLRTLADKDCTHGLIVQDDAVPCADFHDRLQPLLAEKPDTIMPLFVSGAPTVRVPVRRALLNGDRWALLNRQGFVPVVATVYPHHHVRKILDWAAELPERRHTRSDDHMLSLYTRANRLEVWAPVPSLVRHDDETPSLIGGRPGRHRQVLAYVGDDEPYQSEPDHTEPLLA
jgi:hypothetical protein